MENKCVEKVKTMKKSLKIKKKYKNVQSNKKYKNVINCSKTNIYGFDVKKFSW